MNSRALRIGIGLILALIVAVAVERAIVTDEEALRDLAASFVEAAENEELEGVTVLLSSSFGWSGVDPVGRGGLEELPERLAYFWDHMESTRYRYDIIDLSVQGGSAVIDLYGPFRFEWDGWLGLYRAQFQLTAVKEGDAWKLRRIEVTDLQRGAL